MALDLVTAVSFFHREGIVHRDIKSNNTLVTTFPDDDADATDGSSAAAAAAAAASNPTKRRFGLKLCVALLLDPLKLRPNRYE